MTRPLVDTIRDGRVHRTSTGDTEARDTEARDTEARDTETGERGAVRARHRRL
ncbi:hypothetical protein AAY23_10474 [Frankia casuarinae]|nr:hypothetical protein AAY23_10474 [Frankia casuarinae]